MTITNTSSPVCDNSKRVKVNVSGHYFVTTFDTLLSQPHSKLGKAAQKLQDDSDPNQPEIFFDADDNVFREILRYYRTGELHVPNNMCYKSFKFELEFWEIDENEVSECCQSVGKTEEEMEAEFLKFENSIEPGVSVGEMSVRQHIWYLMTDPTGPYTKYRKLSTVYTVVYLMLTIIYSVMMSLNTVSGVVLSGNNASTMRDMLEISFNSPCFFVQDFVVELTTRVIWVFQVTLVVLFALDIFLRLITCPKVAHFIKSDHLLFLIISAVEVIFFIITLTTSKDEPHSNVTGCYVIVIITQATFLASSLRTIKILMISLLLRRVQVLWLAVWRSKMEVGLLILVLAISSIVGGSLVYMIDVYGSVLENSHSMRISNIPSAYWFVIVTMTTVGYGDATPVSLFGHAMTSLFMILGLIFTALPIAIIGSNFALYYSYSLKRDKRKRTRVRTTIPKDGLTNPIETPLD